MAREENKSSGGRGFASMDKEKQREIASKGGRSRGRNTNMSSSSNVEGSSESDSGLM